MKATSFFLKSVLGIALAGYVITACNKDPASSPSGPTGNGDAMDITPAQDDANASLAASDAKNVSDAAIQWQSNYVPHGHNRYNLNFLFGDCITVTGKDTTINNSQDTIVYIKFGNHDCMGNDGRNRRGTIIVYWGLKHPGETWLQAYFDSANIITLLFNGYYLKGVGISGTKTWTNEGHDSAGFQNWNYTDNITLTYASNQIATWNTTRNTAIVEVGGNWYYEINGSGSGVSKNGIKYTVDITSPLYITLLPWWAGGCYWPEAGTVTITRSSPSETLTVNYGPLGTCSANKNVNINGNIRAFVLW